MNASTNVTLATITGLSGFSLAASGVYEFDAYLSGTSTTNGGMNLAFKFTTMTATALDCTAVGYTATGVNVQHATSTTSEASLFALTAAATISVRLTGRITIGTAGTLALEFAQNSSHSDTSSIYAGSWLNFRKVS